MQTGQGSAQGSGGAQGSGKCTGVRWVLRGQTGVQGSDECTDVRPVHSDQAGAWAMAVSRLESSGHTWSRQYTRVSESVGVSAVH